MGLIRWLFSFFTGGKRAGEPVGAVRVYDPSPLNWLWVLYNTAEELIRVTPRGKVHPAVARLPDPCDFHHVRT
jgi:hypothetical protein